MSTMTPEARALAALGHDARLAIFRLLVKAGDAGLNVGQIGAHLGIAPSTLAHHLGALVEAGLVRQDRLGREVVNHAAFAAIQRLTDFLVAECCAGLPALQKEEATG
jgi:ArsR family transcriptional regulator, arsenate/arsenite/antimonite-responsive transcriptional repressor